MTVEYHIALYNTVLAKVAEAMAAAGLDLTIETTTAVAFQGLLMSRAHGLTQRQALDLVQVVFLTPEIGPDA